MKKIFVCTPFENKMAKRGTRTLKIAEIFLGLGHKVEFVTTNFSHARKEFFSADEISYYQDNLPYKLTVLNIFGYKSNISIGRVLSHLYLTLKYFLYLFPRVKQGDVVYTPSRPPELYFMNAVLKSLRKVKTIIDITDIWPDALVGTSSLKFKIFKTYCDFFNSYALKRIDSVTHSAPCFQNWLNRYAPKANSEFIPLGYDADRWPEKTAVPKDGITEPIKLVYVGQLQHQIDLEQIIRAVCNNSRYEMNIIGGGEDYDKWRNLADELGMQNARFTGYIPYEQVVEELFEKHLGLLPMISSSIPNKMFDYVAAGLPVLVLGRNDSADFVVQNGIGWEDDFDVGSLKMFFNNLDINDIYSKSQKVVEIRPQYSKETLYGRFVPLVEK